MSIRPLFTQNASHTAVRSDESQHADSISGLAPKQVVATTRSDRTGQYLWTLWIALLATVFLSMLVSRASGQQYESIPMPAQLQDEALVKRVESTARSFALTGAASGASYAKGYFGVYVPAKMTAKGSEKDITPIVEQTLNLLGRAERSNRPAVAKALRQYVFTGMKKVAEGNHHPAARINAVIVLSRLDRQPADNARRSPPIPMQETWPILLKLYEDESNSDGVRAAALQGIRRHVSYGFPQIPAADKTKVIGLMTNLLDAEAPEGRSPEAHAFLQRYAVDIIDTLRADGDKTLGTKLVSISTKPDSPDLIALYSAKRLGKMGAELQGEIQDPTPVLDAWSKRLLNVFEGELARLDGLEKAPAAQSQPVKPEAMLEVKQETTSPTRAAAGPDAMGDMDSMMEGMDDYSMMADEMGGMEDMMGDPMMMMMMQPGGAATEIPQPPEVTVSRERLNSVLEQIHAGVTGDAAAGMPRTPGGLLASVADDKKPIVEKWVTAMQEVNTGINDKTLADRKAYREVLVAQIEALREVAGVDEDEPAAAAEADDLPDDFAPVDELSELEPEAGGDLVSQ